MLCTVCVVVLLYEARGLDSQKRLNPTASLWNDKMTNKEFLTKINKECEILNKIKRTKKITCLKKCERLI